MERKKIVNQSPLLKLFTAVNYKCKIICVAFTEDKVLGRVQSLEQLQFAVGTSYIC